MRKTILALSFILVASVGLTHSQAVFKKYGFNKKPLTLSKGKYNEFFTNDEVVQIGTVKFNTRTNKVIKFLVEDTTKTNYISDRSSIWYGVDPLCEKYPNYSPYVYCMNNPVKYIDPDGKRVLPSTIGLYLIRNTLTSTEAQYVQLDKNGYIDANILMKGQSELGKVGGNYSALLTIAQNDNTVEVSAPNDKFVMNDNYAYVGGSNIAFPFKDPIVEDGEFTGSGGLGITLAPIGTQRTEHDAKQKQMLESKDRNNSSNGNFQVQINGRLLPFQGSKKDAVKTTAHELYGHLLFMFLKKDALHAQERTGPNSNQSLEHQINQRTKEAEKNYNNQTK